MDVFGCTEQELDDFYNSKPSYVSKDMLIVSMLSDAQEEMALGLMEKSRQTLNRAKYILCMF